jgi:hypothetical protein
MMAEMIKVQAPKTARPGESQGEGESEVTTAWANSLLAGLR